MADKSVCQCGHPISFYYANGPAARHKEHAVGLLLDEINKPPRYLGNEFLQDEAAGAFMALLDLAESGTTRSPEHIKSIQTSPDIDMFELRWCDIPVMDTDPVSGLYGETYEIQVRMYIIEVGERWTVGVHLHEKCIKGSSEHVRLSQNQEISQAVRLAKDERVVAWRVPELEGREF